MKKVIVLMITLFLFGCTNNEVINENNQFDNSLESVVDQIEVSEEIVKYDNGTMNVKFSSYEDFDDKEIEILEVENLLKVFNYSEIVEADYKGPASIIYYYTNSLNETFEFRIWSSDTFEFGKVGVDCPQMNCTKFYKIKSDFDLIKYSEKIYNEVK